MTERGQQQTGRDDAVANNPLATRPRGPRRLFFMLGAIILLIGLAVAWNNRVRHWVSPRKWAVVEPSSIYRSGQVSRHLVERTLRDHNIRTIVCLHGDDNDDVRAERAAAERLGIQWLNYPLDGKGRGDIRHYALALGAMEQARKEGKPVLVHCYSGAQRTGGVVAMYRLLIQRRPVEEAVREMRRFGYDPDDNPYLAPFLNERVVELAQLLVAMKVVDSVPQPLPRMPVR